MLVSTMEEYTKFSRVREDLRELTSNLRPKGSVTFSQTSAGIKMQVPLGIHKMR